MRSWGSSLEIHYPGRRKRGDALIKSVVRVLLVASFLSVTADRQAQAQGASCSAAVITAAASCGLFPATVATAAATVGAGTPGAVLTGIACATSLAVTVDCVKKMNEKLNGEGERDPNGMSPLREVMDVFDSMAVAQGFGRSAMCLPPNEVNPATPFSAFLMPTVPTPLTSPLGEGFDPTAIRPATEGGGPSGPGAGEPRAFGCPCDTPPCYEQWRSTIAEGHKAEAFGYREFLGFLVDQELLPSEYGAAITDVGDFLFQARAGAPLAICGGPYDPDSYCAIIAPIEDGGPFWVLGEVRQDWLFKRIMAGPNGWESARINIDGYYIEFPSDEEAVDRQQLHLCTYPGEWNGEECEYPQDPPSEEPGVPPIDLSKLLCNPGTKWDGRVCAPTVPDNP